MKRKNTIQRNNCAWQFTASLLTFGSTLMRKVTSFLFAIERHIVHVTKTFVIVRRPVEIL